MEQNNSLNSADILEAEFGRQESLLLRFGALIVLFVIVIAAIALSIITVDRHIKTKVICERTGDFTWQLPQKISEVRFLFKTGQKVSRGSVIAACKIGERSDSIVTSSVDGFFSTDEIKIPGSNPTVTKFIRVSSFSPSFQLIVSVDKFTYQQDLAGSILRFSSDQNENMKSLSLKAVLLHRANYNSFSNEQYWIAEMDSASSSLVAQFGWKTKTVTGEGVIIVGKEPIIKKLFSK
jgi:hypothetical protein